MITVLHTADWHIDAPLRNFTEHQRRELRSAMLSLPGQIADLCLREDCDLALLAGDIFDGPYTREGYEAVYRALQRMEIPVFIAPGNHDPYREDSIWVRETWPENVYLFRSQEITSYSIEELDCRVYGTAFTAAEAPGLLEGFQAQCDERHALLLLHGDPTNPDSPYCPVTAAQLWEAGLDYAALGHIHARGEFRSGAGLCAWPGCPMGRGWDETGTKGVLVTQLGETARTRFLPLELPRFFDESVAAGEDPVAALASMLPPGGSRDHFRIRLTGEVRPGDTDGLARRFSRHWPNLTILDETVPLGDLWEGAEADSLSGLFFRTLREGAQNAPEEEVHLYELAARIGRRILEGREVELP
jgi:DNA repair exonuclease SbcCD nuclease subunit